MIWVDLILDSTLSWSLRAALPSFFFLMSCTKRFRITWFRFTPAVNLTRNLLPLLFQGAVLRGVIKSSGIVCSCASCKGRNVSSPPFCYDSDLPCHSQPIYHVLQVVSPYYFEVHAGSLKKRPSDYIFLENGRNNLYGILKACAGATLDTLEAAIRTAIGPTPQKRTVRCKACKSGLFFPLIHTKLCFVWCSSFDRCLTFFRSIQNSSHWEICCAVWSMCPV